MNIGCERCRTPIHPDHINTDEFAACAYCQELIQTHVFAAAYREEPKEQHQPETVVTDEAGCFFHPGKKAKVPCSSCGRFLCALCDIEMDDIHICFSCMESGTQKKQVDTFENHRFLADSFALRLSVLPVLTIFFFYFTLVTAPISIYYVIRYWNKENSIISRSKWRFVAAFIFSTLQIIGWVVFIFMIFWA